MRESLIQKGAVREMVTYLLLDVSQRFIVHLFLSCLVLDARCSMLDARESSIENRVSSIQLYFYPVILSKCRFVN